MWTEITRANYDRSDLRCANDLTDADLTDAAWALSEPLLSQAKWLGRLRTTDLREVVNALLYIMRTGCQWRMLTREASPRSTMQRYFYAWREDGTSQRIKHELLMQARLADGREAGPSAGIIDS
ncbi:MAG TPA: transposase [Gammaproteobacteria bacterium]